MDCERLMVKDWDRVFFYAEAYKVRGEIQWGRWPACRRSLAYSRLAKTTAGHTAMWVFGAIVGMLHKRRSTDGLMVHENGAPFSIEDIRTMSELTTKQVVASMAMLRSTEIGWIRPEAEERNRRTKRDQPGGNRATTGQQPGDRRAATGLEERREEKNSISSIGIPGSVAPRTPEPAAAAAEASPPDEGERQRKIEALCRRPAWLRDGMGWIDADGAREILGLPGMHQGIWDDVVKQAKHDKNLKNPAGYIIAKLRKACGVKKGGAA